MCVKPHVGGNIEDLREGSAWAGAVWRSRGSCLQVFHALDTNECVQIADYIVPMLIQVGIYLKLQSVIHALSVPLPSSPMVPVDYTH